MAQFAYTYKHRVPGHQQRWGGQGDDKAWVGKQAETLPAMHNWVFTIGDLRCKLRILHPSQIKNRQSSFSNQMAQFAYTYKHRVPGHQQRWGGQGDDKAWGSK